MLLLRGRYSAQRFDGGNARRFVLQSFQQQGRQAVRLVFCEMTIVIAATQFTQQTRGGHQCAFLDFLIDIVCRQEWFDAPVKSIRNGVGFFFFGC